MTATDDLHNDMTMIKGMMSKAIILLLLGYFSLAGLGFAFAYLFNARMSVVESEIGKGGRYTLEMSQEDQRHQSRINGEIKAEMKLQRDDMKVMLLSLTNLTKDVAHLTESVDRLTAYYEESRNNNYFRNNNSD